MLSVRIVACDDHQSVKLTLVGSDLWLQHDFDSLATVCPRAPGEDQTPCPLGHWGGQWGIRRSTGAPEVLVSTGLSASQESRESHSPGLWVAGSGLPVTERLGFAGNQSA